MDHDEELIRNYIRVEGDGGNLVIFAGAVEWEGPYTPSRKWKKATSLPADSNKAEIDQAIRQVLSDTRFFRVCSECHQRNVLGHMVSDFCHSCGERNHGIVF
ncbi:MAG: hypothetical protein KDA81_14025 [Planctomycetaceae bacterium]|nr:hypothetical protein [Planctomycetaceae bacterium]